MAGNHGSKSITGRVTTLSSGQSMAAGKNGSPARVMAFACGFVMSGEAARGLVLGTLSTYLEK